ncbi:high mobility group nucleosome-binding domain-containing protein 3 isoform X1 [Clinocottus analis]|uniref:high mobility group nucleosome-binding domain-containing protein 3 isoform X1 n=1 Tax=Clinocottus analis TaxID=304258 RepID=UPI0035C03F75
MPKRKSPEVPEGKETSSKVTKQETPRRSERLSAKPAAAAAAPPKPETKPKKAIVKKVADDKVPAKAKKSAAKGKKDDGPAHNGETKTNETSGSTGGQFRGEKEMIPAATRGVTSFSN